MRSLFAFLSLAYTINTLGQDTLVFKNKEKVVILLMEVNPDNIKYKRFDNQAGATYTVLKSEVDFIGLSNGKREKYNITLPAAIVTKSDTVASPAITGTTLSASQKANSCDTLFFRSGKKIPVTVYDLTPAEIKYKPLSNPDGPVYTVNKSEIKEVVFSTGMKQTFGETASTPAYTAGSGSSSSMILKGTRDAKTYYKHLGGSVGTGITAFIFPLAGLIPAVICSSVPPKPHNLGYPDDNLWQNKDYRTSYSKEAYRIKRKRVWSGFGIGTAATVLLYILLAQ